MGCSEVGAVPEKHNVIIIIIKAWLRVGKSDFYPCHWLWLALTPCAIILFVFQISNLKKKQKTKQTYGEVVVGLKNPFYEISKANRRLLT